MRLSPERLKLLGQQPRPRVSVRPPFNTLRLPRSRGLTRTSSRLTEWYLRTMFEAGHSTEFTTQEMSKDRMDEMLNRQLEKYGYKKPSRFNQDLARSGRFSASTSNRSNVPRSDMTFMESSTTGAEIRLLDDPLFPRAEEHYVSMGTSVPCKPPCPLCITQGVQKNIPHGWKWKA